MGLVRVLAVHRKEWMVFQCLAIEAPLRDDFGLFRGRNHEPVLRDPRGSGAFRLPHPVTELSRDDLQMPWELGYIDGDSFNEKEGR